MSEAPMKVYGAPWCPHCRRVKRFLSGLRVRYETIDVDERPEALDGLRQLQGGGQIIPMVVYPDGSYDVNPSNEQLAGRLGLTLEAASAVYDLVIVGGGPAGLAAAIYAAREGIEAVVVDANALGGQASVTNRIDNYPGFPEGISGGELTSRFIEQCRRYGVELLSAVAVSSVAPDGSDLSITLSNGQLLTAPVVIVATGSTYRRLNVPGEDDLIGAGVHFCATCDGPLYKGEEELIVIGGGNSALEEGLHLSEFAKRIRVLARSGLSASSVLQDRVRSDPQFVIETDLDIEAIEGEAGRFSAVLVRDRASSEPRRLPAAAAFVFVGLTPNNAFLDGSVARDEGGFLTTAANMETTMAGVFAAGDVRSGSTKQLGSAVGEGIAALLMARRTLEARRLKSVARVADGAPA
jgi:thioredoxin reductase (NADPH)